MPKFFRTKKRMDVQAKNYMPPIYRWGGIKKESLVTIICYIQCVQHLCGSRVLLLTYSQRIPGFYESFENTVGKWEIARNKQFLLFLHCFLPIWRTFCHFHRIRNWQIRQFKWSGTEIIDFISCTWQFHNHNKKFYLWVVSRSMLSVLTLFRLFQTENKCSYQFGII